MRTYYEIIHHLILVNVKVRVNILFVKCWTTNLDVTRRFNRLARRVAGGENVTTVIMMMRRDETTKHVRSSSSYTRI